MKSKIALLISFIFIVCMMNAQNFDKDSFQTAKGEELDLFFVKHASLILKYEGKWIYVDPLNQYMHTEELPKADVILVTHEHGDHFDPQAIRTLTKNDTKIVLNESCREKLNEGISLKNGDSLQVTGYLSLQAVPAYNITLGRESLHPKGRDNGYVLNIGGLHIYISGDTEDIQEIKKLKNIDIAFLPVNQPYTMTVDQAVRAARWFSPKVLYPYHYGETNVSEIKEMLKNETAIDVRIRQLQ